MQIVFGFDMETDIGSWSYEYEGIKQGTPRILQILEKHDIKTTFFWVGDTVKKFPEIVSDIAEQGHEVGCHSLFHETVGEPLFPVPGVYPVLKEELKHRLELNKQYVSEACGVDPVSFRSPRLFGGTHVVNVLEDLGFLTDASYPLYFYREHVLPYHPDNNDWSKKGDMKLLELPNFADLSMDSKDKYGRDMDQWPLFRTEGSEALLKHIDDYSKWLGDIEPFLCFYFHPWEFVEMPQGDIYIGEGYVRPDKFIVMNCGDFALRELDKLIQGLKDRDARFMTCRECVSEYP